MNKIIYGRRIRYAKHPEDPVNMVRSVKSYRINDMYYFLDLHKVSFQFNVRSTVDNSIIASGGKTKNLAVLKIQAKKALEELGICFAPDIRTYRDDVEANVTVTTALNEDILDDE